MNINLGLTLQSILMTKMAAILKNVIVLSGQVEALVLEQHLLGP